MGNTYYNSVRQVALLQQDIVSIALIWGYVIQDIEDNLLKI